VPKRGTERVGEDGRIVLANPPTIDLNRDILKVTSRCYFDVSIGGASAQRITIDLYGEICPRAAENFRALCTGEKGFGYAGSRFFRVVSGLTLQGGDILGPDSRKARSVYGDAFEHDNYKIAHSVSGLVSMSNAGVGGSSSVSDSRFLIQLPQDGAFLDGRYEAFARVSGGMDVLQAIERVRVTGTKNAPVDPVTIVQSGELENI